MLTLPFSVQIRASREKVWSVLWDLPNYEEWVAVFSEGSTVKTDNWKEGTKLRFVNTEDSGIVSVVAANRPLEFMSFRHLGTVNKGVEDTESDAVNSWAGAIESYSLSGTDGQCLLEVKMDTTEDYAGYFREKWPLALEKIKAMAES